MTEKANQAERKGTSLSMDEIRLAVGDSQLRILAMTKEISMLTHTLAERDALIQAFENGKVLKINESNKGGVQSQSELSFFADIDTIKQKEEVKA